MRISGRPQAAVIGAGVAGLTAAYLLQRRYDVTLYEAQDRLGGHAHTHDVISAGGRALALDSGFLVHSTHSYPHLIRLFGELGVSTQDTRGSYRRYFVSHFVIPLVAAVWSCPPGDALAYPARYLFQFLDHHGMLRLARSPGWRTVTGGSRAYVDLVAKQLTTVTAGLPVRAIRRVAGGVDIHDQDGGTRHFARAVVATHPDEALRLLDPPTPAEKQILGAFRYTSSQVLLHTDAAVLPRAPAARASWNHLLRNCSATAGGVHVSYHLNRLQGLDVPADYLVTLNALDRVRPGRVLARMTYRHPLYDQPAVAAQRRLAELNTPPIAFAGAYHGWGFHEDGCRSGAEAARALGMAW